MLGKVSKDDFQEIIGTETVVTVLDGPDLALTLEHIIEHTKPEVALPEGCRAEPFTLILKGPVDHQVPDGVYDITFDRIGLIESTYLDNKFGEAGTPSANSEKPEHVFYEIIFS
ncbi:hypothetical protein KFE96_13525 [Kordiimonas sp. SCSIO 12603]|uniref:DUF6916 family protein n=1 Tax=Kordiimonas sp. SCSIO 12603 TaxID=2829596 RepID=UPI00210747BE|nr:hypothetical protein [Kordiimonas sp. SCSIO 12603]UTW57844.1 hypothetical protein KFE96_13525 [Kordiimonas sp. SCSIO 12603]